ncbi:hypothetical protein MA16_Dca015176 [Dendrobium catenatum]|uniref:Uncharacterized protein n=1 Tax=Dendrobium catenatum TaxID=906689 RepID=A0A2I0XAN8_9ASPA|nr:hypothetical protein MA16_Dca015176 [Dendrobium catenatum]
MKSQLLRPNILQAFEYKCKDNRWTTTFFHLIICCSVYHIWRERNDRKFGNTFSSSTTLSLKIKSAVFAKVLKWKHCCSLLNLL